MDTSKILAQISSKYRDSNTKGGKNSSSSDIDLSIPPGLNLKEAIEIIDVKEKLYADDKEDGLQSKSGDSSPLSFKEEKEIEVSDVKENKNKKTFRNVLL